MPDSGTMSRNALAITSAAGGAAEEAALAFTGMQLLLEENPTHNPLLETSLEYLSATFTIPIAIPLYFQNVNKAVAHWNNPTLREHYLLRSLIMEAIAEAEKTGQENQKKQTAFYQAYSAYYLYLANLIQQKNAKRQQIKQLQRKKENTDRLNEEIQHLNEQITNYQQYLQNAELKIISYLKDKEFSQEINETQKEELNTFFNLTNENRLDTFTHTQYGFNTLCAFNILATPGSALVAIAAINSLLGLSSFSNPIFTVLVIASFFATLVFAISFHNIAIELLYRRKFISLRNQMKKVFSEDFSTKQVWTALAFIGFLILLALLALSEAGTWFFAGISGQTFLGNTSRMITNLLIYPLVFIFIGVYLLFRIRNIGETIDRLAARTGIDTEEKSLSQRAYETLMEKAAILFVLPYLETFAKINWESNYLKSMGLFILAALFCYPVDVLTNLMLMVLDWVVLLFHCSEEGCTTDNAFIISSTLAMLVGGLSDFLSDFTYVFPEKNTSKINHESNINHCMIENKEDSIDTMKIMVALLVFATILPIINYFLKAFFFDGKSFCDSWDFVLQRFLDCCQGHYFDEDKLTDRLSRHSTGKEAEEIVPMQNPETKIGGSNTWANFFQPPNVQPADADKINEISEHGPGSCLIL